MNTPHPVMTCVYSESIDAGRGCILSQSPLVASTRLMCTRAGVHGRSLDIPVTAARRGFRVHGRTAGQGLPLLQGGAGRGPAAALPFRGGGCAARSTRCALRHNRTRVLWTGACLMLVFCCLWSSHSPTPINSIARQLVGTSMQWWYVPAAPHERQARPRTHACRQQS